MGYLMNRKTLLCSLLALFISSAANASPFQVDFTFTGFTGHGGSPVPDPTVTGSAVFDAASINSPIQSLISINLSIDGHTYTLAETGILVSGDQNVIGGLLNGVGALGFNTTDFAIVWRYTTNEPVNFSYESGANPIVSSTASTFSIAAVPEPTTLALFSLGAFGMCLSKRYHAARPIAAGLAA